MPWVIERRCLSIERQAHTPIHRVALLQVACDQPVLDAQSSEEDATMRGAREQDVLHVQLETRQAETDGYILSAARLVAPLLYAHSWTKGFDWCREQLNAASLGALASEVHLAQANEHLARKCYAAAVVLLKEFARGDSRQRAAAAVNLTTLSLLDGRLEAAAGYGDYCCEANPGSAQPMISRANVHMAQAQAEMALQASVWLRAAGGAVGGCSTIWVHWQRPGRSPSCSCTRMRCSWKQAPPRPCSTVAWHAARWASTIAHWQQCKACCTPIPVMPRPCGRRQICVRSSGTQSTPRTGSPVC